ncbi:MAG: B12-binding domain-containing radical SAM protein [Clostridia bacterium]|nr:B12-binding domain-containing radical SAM protein [Clostridia bacterium]
MKRIYMVQPSTVYGTNVYLPYTVGSLIAYAFADDTVRREYDFGCFIYKKEELADVIARMEEPFLIGFSCYLWNYEYNKALAAEVKKKWPRCVTVFGGHQICRESDVLHGAVADVILFGEGEESFKRVLLAYAGLDELSRIPNAAYRRDGRFVFTPEEAVCIPQRASPYLGGWFDDILRAEPEISFFASVETNRGCPNNCAFCDYGNIKAHVRLYDAAMVNAEIEWAAAHRIEILFILDANFGLFPRDEAFVDLVIQKKKETGYPQKFQVSFSKNNPDTVFALNKKINDAGMSKGATLSFQSMSPTVQQNIFRKNIPLDHFKRLLQLYRNNGIPTYSELILGLPGETYESFRDGLELLLENGQHSSVILFNCELLNNSVMNSPAYLKKHGIRAVTIEENVYHVVPSCVPIKEYSRIVVATDTMPEAQWVDANILGVFIRAFHNLGLLQCFAIWLYYEKGVAYTDFYERFIAFAAARPDTVVGELLDWMEKKYRDVLRGVGTLTWQDPAFGPITWPMEESVFLMVVRDLGRYSREIRAFLSGIVGDEALLRDLWAYQSAVVKTPFLRKQEIACRWDWRRYFADVYDNRRPTLVQAERRYLIDPGDVPADFPTFAKKTIWFGRRGGQNIVSDIQEIPADA